MCKFLNHKGSCVVVVNYSGKVQLHRNKSSQLGAIGFLRGTWRMRVGPAQLTTMVSITPYKKSPWSVTQIIFYGAQLKQHLGHEPIRTVQIIWRYMWRNRMKSEAPQQSMTGGSNIHILKFTLFPLKKVLLPDSYRLIRFYCHSH